MTVLQQLAPGDLRRIVSTYRDALRTHQDELNALNVYPVPDGDTGTNMALTLESVVGELDANVDAGGTPAMETDSMERVCEAIRHGSLMGARGNSGVILSQILRGMADTFAPLDSVSGADVAAGLRRAADAAYQAVLRPVEGTILTVVRSAAESVERAVSEGETTLAGVLERAAGAARDAVASTPDLLPVLREAGVVDAGGRGFELLIAACQNVVSGTPLPAAEEVHSRVAVAASGASQGRSEPWRRRRRSPLRGHVLPRRARRADRRLQDRVGRARRLDRRGRRRGPLELPRAHRRHRCGHRSRHRGRPSA